MVKVSNGFLFNMLVFLYVVDYFCIYFRFLCEFGKVVFIDRVVKICEKLFNNYWFLLLIVFKESIGIKFFFGLCINKV